jgi:hypothetical protein
MQKTLTTMAIGVAFLSATVSALAQDTDIAKPVGLQLRVGVFVPTETDIRNGSNGWFAGGVEYRLGKFLPIAGPTDLSLSLDYTAKNDDRSVPLLLNLVQHRGQLFYSVGAGVSFANVVEDDGSEDDKTLFGYQGGIGWDLGTGATPFFVEGKYFGTRNKELDGFGFFVGMRF